MVRKILPLFLLLGRLLGSPGQLVDQERSALVVVDVQQPFLAQLDIMQRQPLVHRIAFLMQVANVLEIPIIATAEDMTKNGGLVEELEALLPTKAGVPTPVFDKFIWNLAAQDNIRSAVEATGRDTFIIVGLVTDVCVCQSALGLQEAGFRPVVIDDACGSPGPHHDFGIRRLTNANVTIQSVKGIYYEWVRSIPEDDAMTAALGNATAGCFPDYYPL